MPLLVLAAGCSSDKDQEALNLPEEMNVVVTISGSETRAPLPITEEVKNLQRENLNFATFYADGKLKHYLFKGATNDANKSVSAFYFVPSWGPSVSAKLKREDYKDDFFIGCFNVPQILRYNSASNPFDIANLDNADMTLMEWPGKEADGYVWNPDNVANKTLMPMAGITKVTKEYMKKYNDNIYQYENTPFLLPDVDLIRALAKIVIIDRAGFIDKVEVKCPKYGALLPELNGWLNQDAILKPVEPTGRSQQEIVQTIKKPTRKQGEYNVYECYMFERSFIKDGRPAPAMDDIRKVVTLYANESSHLINTVRETTPVRFAPYVNGVVADDPDLDLSTFGDGVWQGVMRNTVYTFIIDPPLQGGVQISVSATNWDHVKGDPFEF